MPNTPNASSQDKSSTILADKTAIRRLLRQRRRSLSDYQQRQAAKKLARQLKKVIPADVRHIGLYFPADGEINPLVFGDAARGKHKIYLPHMLSGNHLMFSEFGRHKGLVKKRFGLMEVSRPTFRQPHRLDIVLMPLVGYDKHGHRLGMGGGFYDRTFAYLTGNNWQSKPQLIAVAHHVQVYPELPTEAWDVPVDMVVTDRHIIRCQPQAFRKV
ncbi:5-formyltetrahydrofolate cyclo-ligase [BD1-7 clade bacterium]|uniref:5-formyltetrahydrofolate cyclo-ligase n=1 Tax=BD1-7 clade bacterium TaxID=2029982 RepID=A0A5S9N3Q6_9GAMM|nr:5-formyltetrahydrofolate cyclo-ligase [BD1-7 clade bacterium]CAA0084485.1 5-formyltetrahydrofolate cyclo-ligase [BD1-7 clade bacterium]